MGRRSKSEAELKVVFEFMVFGTSVYGLIQGLVSHDALSEYFGLAVIITVVPSWFLYYNRNPDYKVVGNYMIWLVNLSFPLLILIAFSLVPYLYIFVGSQTVSQTTVLSATGYTLSLLTISLLVFSLVIAVRRPENRCCVCRRRLTNVMYESKHLRRPVCVCCVRKSEMVKHSWVVRTLES